MSGLSVEGRKREGTGRQLSRGVSGNCVELQVESVEFLLVCGQEGRLVIV